MGATFAYVSNAEDGDIGVYSLNLDGVLKSLARVPVGTRVGPLAASPDRRYLYAAVRSKPFTAHAFAIDPRSGALEPLATAPLAVFCAGEMAQACLSASVQTGR